jgi:hypothetical protein
MEENEQSPNPGFLSEELRNTGNKKPSWLTDTVIVNGRPFTIIFPEEE